MYYFKYQVPKALLLIVIIVGILYGIPYITKNLFNSLSSNLIRNKSINILLVNGDKYTYHKICKILNEAEQMVNGNFDLINFNILGGEWLLGPNKSGGVFKINNMVFYLSRDSKTPTPIWREDNEK